MQVDWIPNYWKGHRVWDLVYALPKGNFDLPFGVNERFVDVQEGSRADFVSIHQHRRCNTFEQAAETVEARTVATPSGLGPLAQTPARNIESVSSTTVRVLTPSKDSLQSTLQLIFASAYAKQHTKPQQDMAPRRLGWKGWLNLTSEKTLVSKKEGDFLQVLALPGLNADKPLEKMDKVSEIKDEKEEGYVVTLRTSTVEPDGTEVSTTLILPAADAQTLAEDRMKYEGGPAEEAEAEEEDFVIISSDLDALD